MTAFLGSNAFAQESVLIGPSIPFSYDKGRNVSVTEKPRPEYDAAGRTIGSFEIYPRIAIGAGSSSNIYLVPDDETSSALVTVAPNVRLASNWSRHYLGLVTSGEFVRYPGNSLRNEDNWRVQGTGRADLGTVYTVMLDVEAAREQEEPFASASQADVPTLSSFRRNSAVLRGQYRQGRTRLIVSGDIVSLRFNPILLDDDARIDQGSRDRDQARLAMQGEYALSPSISVYLKAGVDQADYKQADGITGAKRDSKGWRAVGGLNADLSGFLRGSVGVGYSQRNYDSVAYEDVSGFSVEGRLEYFPSERTTYTLTLSRVIEDAAIGNAAAFFDNRAGLKVDHELLYNLILTARADYGTQDYIDTDQKTRSWRVGGGGRYLVSPFVQLSGEVRYGSRESTNLLASSGERDELRTALSIQFQL